MIKIHTYDKHPNGKLIFELYLYLAALALPFSPEDVWGRNQLKINDKIIKADDFIKKKKVAKNKRDKSQKFEQDQLSAAQVIYNNNEALYKFLYTDSPIEKPVINPQRLKELLTAKMDNLSDELKKVTKCPTKDKDELLQKVFRYNAFSKNKKATEMLKAMNVLVCPYCNRQYTFTVSDEDGTSRPQFDHFLPKEKYPYFAVSIHNLVPCCSLCNLAKKNKEGFLYPYSEEMGYNVKFETKYLSDFRYLFGDRNAIDKFEVSVNIVNNDLDEEYEKRVKKSIKKLHLNKLYNGHKDYILNLFMKNYVFNDDYIEMLFKEFPDMFSSLKDVKNLMYLMNIEKEHWGERTLAKLTHDIDLEITSYKKPKCTDINRDKLSEQLAYAQERGREEEREQNITILINILQGHNFTNEQIVTELMDKYELSEEKAQEKLKSKT